MDGATWSSENELTSQEVENPEKTAHIILDQL